MLNDFIRLLYPRHCFVCKNPLVKGEKSVCLKCEFNLPHYDNLRNPLLLSRLFWGRVDIQNVFSFLRFEKGNSVQKLLFELKYNGEKMLGELMGRWFADDLLKINQKPGFDLIVPVPLHYKKLRKRGYNQSASIGKGLSEGLGVPMNVNVLKRIKYAESQTARHRFERWVNIEGSFNVARPDKLKDQHVLLVDDVLTTGSTLEAAATEILKISGARVSVATLAYTV